MICFNHSLAAFVIPGKSNSRGIALAWADYLAEVIKNQCRLKGMAVEVIDLGGDRAGQEGEVVRNN